MFVFILKEVRPENQPKGVFFVRHKDKRKHNQHFLHIKIKFPSLKFSSLFPRNEKTIRADQSILQVFVLCLKRNDSQTFKSNNCTKNVCPVCMLLVQLSSIR